MAAEDEPPSLAQVETVRAGTRDRIGGEGEDRFDPRDVAKLMADDGFVARFWIHAFFIPGDRVENAVNLVIDTFKWRKDFGVNDITEADLDMEILERGSLYYHNRDKKGSRLLVFCIRKHNKDSKKMETMKKMLIYLLERLDKEEAGKRITIIFDSEGAGLSNFDLEQVKFLIHVLISYYPNFVEKILVNISCLVCICLNTSASIRSIRGFVITDKAPTRAFSWLKAATTAFTLKTLLRHYANRALTPRSLNVKLGP